MANPTTNYGFVLPTPTDLVTDLPADFDIALQGVDTRLKALQPGTTEGDLVYASATANTNLRLGIGTAGQVLAVVAGVPAWATTADQTPLTTKGDLFTFTTVDARLPVGTNGQVLTCDSTQSTGLKYATPASGSTFVGCSVYKSTTDQIVANSTDTTVSYNAEEFDTDNFHDDVTNNSRITIPAGKAGKYLILSTIQYVANATGIREMKIVLNGTTAILANHQHSATSSSSYRGSMSGIRSLAVADFIEVVTFQSSGGNLDMSAAQNANRFAAIYLGA